MNLSYQTGKRQNSVSVGMTMDGGAIAEVSHELRLPIANLKLLIETLLDGAGADEQMRQHFLLKAAGEVERLQQLVASLLQEQQAAFREADFECQWNCLRSRVDAAVELINPAIRQKQLKVELEIEPGWQIYANCQQLDQVLLNLLENAVKFTESGGWVKVQSGPVAGAFRVVDSGIGMPEAEIPKIFNRFYRIDRTKSRGSTGLGLSIVKHILDLHGAKISVFSKVGQGSEFQLEFPDRQMAVGAK